METTETIKTEPLKSKNSNSGAPKKSRSYGTNDILNWKFEKPKKTFPDEWLRHLGHVPGRFLMYVDGDGGHGKTEYIMQEVLMLANHFGKVHLNNIEQGKHVQIKQSVERNDFKNKIAAGKWIYSSITDYKEYRARVKRVNSGRVQIIDSISQWKLTAEEIFDLINAHRQKSFVFVAYKKHFEQNKAIAHLCDIKVRVENFKAISSSRFGGNEVYDIWPERNAKIRNAAPSLFPEQSK